MHKFSLQCKAFNFSLGHDNRVNQTWRKGLGIHRIDHNSKERYRQTSGDNFDFERGCLHLQRPCLCSTTQPDTFRHQRRDLSSAKPKNLKTNRPLSPTHASWWLFHFYDRLNYCFEPTKIDTFCEWKKKKKRSNPKRPKEAVIKSSFIPCWSERFFPLVDKLTRRIALTTVVWN